MATKRTHRKWALRRSGARRNRHQRRLRFYEQLEPRLMLAVQLHSGQIPEDQTWTAEDVHVITDDLLVPEGVTLTIEAGTLVQFDYSDGMLVAGRLNAVGSDTMPILFTGDRDDTGPDGDLGTADDVDTEENGPTTATAGYWTRIEFAPTSTGSEMQHVELRYGGRGSLGIVYVNGGDLDMDHAVMRNSSAYGFRIASANPRLHDITLRENGLAAARMDLASNPDVSGVVLDGNRFNAMFIDRGTVPSDVTWDDADLPYLLDDDVTVPAGVTLTIGAGQIITGSDSLFVDGTLHATGTANAPIIFTSDDDPSLGIDIDTSEDRIPGSGSVGELFLREGSLGNVMDYVELRYGGAAAGVGTRPALTVTSAELTLTNSEITNAAYAGIHIVNSNPTVHGVTIMDTVGEAMQMDVASDPAISDVVLLGNYHNAMEVGGGILPGDTEWNDPDIPYFLNDDVTVPADTTLTIGAGQVIATRDPLYVDGTLYAVGTETAPIIFTSDDDLTVGFDMDPREDRLPSMGEMGEILFQEGSQGNVMDHVELRYGGAHAGVGTRPAIIVTSADLTLRNSIIDQSAYAGIGIVGSDPWIQGVTISNTGGEALNMDLASDPTLRDITLFGNSRNGMEVVGGTLEGDAVWDDADVPYFLRDHVTVPEGTTLAIGPGQMITSYSDSLFVDGRLEARGTLEQPVIFTAANDPQAALSNGTPGRGRWGQIRLGPTDTPHVMDHVELRYGGRIYPAAVFADGGDLQFTNNLIHNSLTAGLAAANGANVIATNNVIAYCGNDREITREEGMLVNSGATLTATNNTIDNNEDGIKVQAATAVLTNNLITNNGYAGLRNLDDAIISAAYNDIYNPDAYNGNIVGSNDLIGAAGNISVDPRYFSPANIEYQLRARSPVVDAGTSDDAPTSDRLGNDRFDDPFVLNRGGGTMPYFDLGAFERQESAGPSDVDLATRTVTIPESGLQDETVHVEWTVENTGTGEAFGTWEDAVYLSADPILTADDVLLGSAQRSVGLGPGQTYSLGADVMLPGAFPGTYHLIVWANWQNAIYEGDALANNRAASSNTIAVDVPELAIGVPMNAELTSTGDTRFFKVQVPDGESLNVRLTGPESSTQELYAKYGDVPSRQSFDQRSAVSGTADQSVAIGSTLAGQYYVMVYGSDIPTAGSFTLTADLAGFSIESVEPSSGSGAGNVTFSVRGSQFDGDAVVRLVDDSGAVVDPLSVYFVDSGTLYATFDLGEASVGWADVQVVNADDTVVGLADAFQVTEGGEGQLVTRLTAPGRARRGRSFEVVVEYENVGSADIVAPLLILQSGDLSQLRFLGSSGEGVESLSLVGVNSEGPAGVLPPGARGQITVVGVPVDAGANEFQLFEATFPSEPIDWANLGSDLRPADIEEAIWESLLPGLEGQIGTSWQAYHAEIAHDATLLPPALGLNYSAQDVFQLSMERAYAELGTSASGRLFLGDDSHPLANATIVLVDADQGLRYRGVSLMDGSFLIPVVDSGQYDVFVEGYALVAGSPISVGDTDIENVELIAEPASQITGSVMSTDGVPISNIVVTAFDKDGDPNVATTDATGQYAINGLPAGTYTVRAEGGIWTANLEREIELEERASRANVNLVVELAGSISGTITLGAEAIPAATVVAFGPDSISASAVSDVDGSYTISGLPSGTYYLQAYTDDLLPQRIDDVIVLGGGDTSEADIVLGDYGGTLEGTAQLRSDGSSLPYALVSLEGVEGVYSGQADESGEFRVSGVPGGQYELTVFGTTLMPWTADVTIVAQETTTVTATLAREGIVAGSVEDAISGNPLAGVSVYARNDIGVITSAVTDADGSYALKGLDAGQYDIVVGQPGFAGIKQAVADLSVDDSDERVDFSISVSARVAGTVLATDGIQPVTDALVGLSVDDQLLISARTDSDGNYCLLLLTAGIFDLSVSADGLGFSPVTDLTVTSGSSVTQDFVAGATVLHGTITDAGSGEVIDGATIAITRNSDPLRLTHVGTLESDIDGYFAIDTLAEGDYRVVAYADGYASTDLSVTTTASGPSDIPIGLVAESRIEGTVLARDTGEVISRGSVHLVKDQKVREVAIINDDGTFGLSNLGSGTYTLIVNADHRVTYVHEITLAAGEVANIVPMMETPSTKIAGTVSNAEGMLGNAGVIVTTLSGIPITQATTSRTGEYRLTSLPPGDYRLKATAIGYYESSEVRLSIARGQTVSSMDFNLVAAAFADPESPTDHGEASGEGAIYASDWRSQFYPSQRSDHPKRSQYEHLLDPYKCVAESYVVLRWQDLADQAYKDFVDIFNAEKDRFDRSDLAILEAGANATFLAASGTLIGAAVATGSTLTLTVASVGSAAIDLAELVGAWSASVAYGGPVYDGGGMATSDAVATVKAHKELKLQLIEAINNGFKFPDEAIGSVGQKLGVVTDIADWIFDLIASVENVSEAREHFWSGYPEIASAQKRYWKAVEKAADAIIDLDICTEGAPYRSPTDPVNVDEVIRVVGPKVRNSIGGAYDPNDKTGPSAFGDGGFIQPGLFPYMIQFENDPDLGATLPAQEVFVTDVLDEDLDLSTLEFTGFGFNNFDFVVPPGLSYYETTIDLRPEGIELLVPVTLEVDSATRELKATFRSLDPLTFDLPDDIDAGFLPVNDKLLHNGEGYFTYTIRPKESLPTGTEIRNQAEIVFDVNEPILTPETLHTIDIGQPTSSVDTLIETESPSFVVSWSGSDDAGGSEIAFFDVYVSKNDGPFVVWLDQTSETSAIFEGEEGDSLAFYSIATDNVGHAEQAPTTADAETTIAAYPWHNYDMPRDVNNDSFVAPGDVLLIINELNGPQYHTEDGMLILPPPPGVPYQYDVNMDGFVAPIDAVIVVNYLNRPGDDEGEMPSRGENELERFSRYFVAPHRAAIASDVPESSFDPHHQSREDGHSNDADVASVNPSHQPLALTPVAADSEKESLESMVAAIAEDVATQWSLLESGDRGAETGS